jgi:hypothetical protein
MMGCLKRWFMAMGVGVALLVGLTNCVVAPVAPAPSGYVVAPPPVVIHPYRVYRPYRPYHPYRPYRPYYGRYPYGYRW